MGHDEPISSPSEAAPEERRTSLTAVGVAALRALHQMVDEEPRILDDPVVAHLLDPAALDRARNRDDDPLYGPRVRALRSHVVLRSRYAEDCLAAAVRRGVRQYVILGAGLDTFAYRQPLWARDVRILEVDHPASQRAKRERLAAAGIASPPNLELVAIDFERETLRAGLARSSLRMNEPVFLSWLGVTVYLTEDAIEAVFRFVSSLPRSSEIVFTFSPPDPTLGDDRPTSPLAKLAEAVGEPWRTQLGPDRLDAMLRSFGFSNVVFPAPAELAARYFRDRHDLPAPRRARIGVATV
jgi:methyltransferase (TIGR00027 family)